MNARADRRVIEAGDSALLLRIGPPASPGDAHSFDTDINRQAIGIADAIRRTHRAGIRDVLSTYRSVAVFFDPLEADADDANNVYGTPALVTASDDITLTALGHDAKTAKVEIEVEADAAATDNAATTGVIEGHWVKSLITNDNGGSVTVYGQVVVQAEP